MIPAHEPPHSIKELIKALLLLDNNAKEKFESRIKNEIGCSNYLTTSSGRRSLFIVLKVMGVGQGDEIILPAFTSDVVPMIIKESGAIPVPADVKLDDYTLDPKSVQENITDKTKAVIAVHTFGCPADISALSEICRDRNLTLIEDAAPAFGARFKDVSVGTMGDYGIFSYGVGKSISLGTGGGLVVKDEKKFLPCKRYIKDRKSGSTKVFVKVLGSTTLSNPFVYSQLGKRIKDAIVSKQYDNFKFEIEDADDLSDLSYALGILQLDTNIFAKRRENALYYNDVLKNVENLFPPEEPHQRKSVYSRYLVRASSEELRNSICKSMGLNGVEPLIPDHGYPISKDLYPAKYSNTFANSILLSKKLFGIPVTHKISKSLLEKIFSSMPR